MCFGLKGNLDVKDGQLAHLDRNPANSRPDNLAYLCQDCHSHYDKKSNRVQGFTPHEVQYYRDMLYAKLEHVKYEWCLTLRVELSKFDAAKEVVDKAHSLLINFGADVTRKEGTRGYD
jgi:hypothetical protein